MTGKFITFEGGEGVGKSTQIENLRAYLQSLGYETISTREPGGSDGAEKIRNLLVSGSIEEWTSLSELLLMNAARAEHIDKTIRPALNANKFVLCDRFMDSTRAYQGHAGGVALTAISQIEEMVVDTRPDLTFIFDLPTEVGLERAATRGGDDRFERKGQKYHEQVRAGFLSIAQSDPSRCAIINANQSVENVFADIQTALRTRLKIG